MNKHLIYLRKDALVKLKFKTSAADKLEIYRSSNPDWNEFFEDEIYERRSGIEIIGQNFNLCLGEDFGTKAINECDPEKCVSIYNALKNLTPQQATDERIWVYLTHFVFWDYSRARWLRAKDDGKFLKAVESHFFVNGVRGMVRDNAISRLWWMAHVCNRLDYDLKDCLEALMLKQDVRANVMERASFCRSVPVMNSLMKYLIRSYKGNGKLHERGRFRDMCKELNSIGGEYLLGALNPDELDKLMEDIIRDKLHLSPEFE